MFDREGKQFFFEKKNQKTFGSLGSRCRNVRDSKDNRFLALLSKEAGLLLCSGLEKSDSSRYFDG